MEKFEYFDATYDAGARNYIRSRLNELGKEGWEMINFYRFSDFKGEWITFYFKRKI